MPPSLQSRSPMCIAMRNVDAKMVWFEAVLGSRIRMFLGLPDPLVRGPEPPSFSHKGVERTEIMLTK